MKIIWLESHQLYFYSEQVIPMLPRLLCEQLCSLNPDEDRLAFSVIWKMTEDGEVRYYGFKIRFMPGYVLRKITCSRDLPIIRLIIVLMPLRP